MVVGDQGQSWPACFHKTAEAPSGSNPSPVVPPVQSLLELCAGFGMKPKLADKTSSRLGPELLF